MNSASISQARHVTDGTSKAMTWIAAPAESRLRPCHVWRAFVSVPVVRKNTLVPNRQ